MNAVPSDSRPVGELLRDWRRRRGLTQLELGLEAGVSTRHLSYVENGRARPSREMVERLAGFPYLCASAASSWSRRATLRRTSSDRSTCRRWAPPGRR